MTAELIDRAKATGIEIFLDDFGTGYSSLNCLHTLAIDAIKLDRLFIRDLNTDGRHAATIQAVVVLARNRGMGVIAEGVATRGQLAQLQALECDLAQGYLFSKPRNSDDAEALLATGVDWLQAA